MLTGLEYIPIYLQLRVAENMLFNMHITMMHTHKLSDTSIYHLVILAIKGNFGL